MEDKAPQTKYSKNIIKVLVVAAAISIITLASGTSYAILSGTATSDNEQVIKAGSVIIQLTEHFNNLDDGVRILNDADGLLSATTYDFTVKNIGSVGAEYTLKLINDPPQSYSGNVLNINYFNIGLEINGKEYGPMSIEDVNGIIDKNTLAINEVNSYKLRVWLDSSKESKLEGKESYNAFLKLKVEAKQATALKAKNVVYSIVSESDNAYIGSNINAGSHTGYCMVKTGTEPFNSCTSVNFGFTLKSDCQKEINRHGGSTNDFSCVAGSWTSTGFYHTTDYTALDNNVFFKHNVNAYGEVLSTEVCFVYSEPNNVVDQSNKNTSKKITPINLSAVNGDVYCLKGGDGIANSSSNIYESKSFADNKKLIEEIFGINNCGTLEHGDYSCANGLITAYIIPTGQVSISSSDGTYNEACTITDSGSFSCPTR